MTLNEIKSTIKNKRIFEAEYRIIMSTPMPHDDITTEKRIYLEEKLGRIENWLSILSDDEAYTIRRHLIDGIDTSRLVVEYERIWGREYCKTERTFRSYQQRALKKILEFENTFIY